VRRVRLWRGLAVMTAGFALALAYPPMAWNLLAWVALAPLFVVAMRARPGAAFGWGWLGGFVFFLALLRWLNFTFTTYSAIPWPLTWGPTALLAAYCALWIGLVAALAAWLAGRRGRGWALAALPFLWVAAEWGRGHLMGGFPWGLLAYSQWERLPVIQVAELGGVYAVSFILVAVNAAVAAAVLLPVRRALAALALAAVALGGTLGFGVWRLAAPSPAPAEHARIAIMQPAIEQPLKWDVAFAATLLSVYFQLTRSVGAGGADLVVWPETSTPTVLRHDPGLLRALSALAGDLQTTLLVGSVDVDDADPLRLWNTAFPVGAAGIEGRYDKIHLVPFGEYVPLPGLIGFVRGWAEFIAEMEPGADPVVFPGPPAPFGVVICYEGIFPELVREFARRGARVIINMTNDGWFAGREHRTAGPAQHLSMYPFRAVEHRLPVVRAANTGVSAFIDPTGRIVNRLELFERGVITAQVPLRGATTVYTRLGDWLAYLGLGVSGGAVAAAARRRA
jgi:apolipoprotein N-acyltransferase